MSKNFSHAACTHPATKVARAKCRREMAKLTAVLKIAAVSVATVESPIITAWNAMKNGPLELTAAPVAAVEITRENWREFKGQRVVVRVSDEWRSLAGEITGWSPLNFQIKTDEKTVRIPASTVESVSLSESVTV